jgi:hypothetical protein
LQKLVDSFDEGILKPTFCPGPEIGNPETLTGIAEGETFSKFDPFQIEILKLYSPGLQGRYGY